MSGKNNNPPKVWPRLLPEIFMYIFFIFTILFCIFFRVTYKIEYQTCCPDSLATTCLESIEAGSSSLENNSIPFFFGMITIIFTLFMFVSKWNTDRSEQTLRDTRNSCIEWEKKFKTMLNNIENKYKTARKKISYIDHIADQFLGRIPILLQSILFSLDVKFDFNEKESLTLIELFIPERAPYAVYEFYNIIKFDNQQKIRLLERLREYYCKRDLDESTRDRILSTLSETIKKLSERADTK